MRHVVFTLLFALPLAAAPVVREKGPPPITPKNVESVREVGSIERDAWQLDFLPESGALALTPWEGDIEVFDRRTLKPDRKLAAGKRLVHLAFSRDGGRLAWVENNTRVTIEDRKTGKAIAFDAGRSQPSLAFSPDGAWLVAGAGLWDAASGKKLRDFDTGVEGGLTPVFSPNGKVLAIGNRNSVTKLFDPETGRELFVLPKTMTQGIAFNPAGTRLAATYVDGSLGVWEVGTGKLVRETKTSAAELYRVDWNPAGDLLLTSGREAKITLWDPAELKILREFDAPAWVIGAKFTPDGSRFLTAGGGHLRGQDRKVKVWGLGDGR